MLSNYTPQGWTASKKTREFVNAHYPFIKRLVDNRIQKYYNICGMDAADLLQEGMIAATYAIDTYNPAKSGSGKLNSYINIVVGNSIAMVASAANASCRNPMMWVHNGEEWVKVRQSQPAELDDIVSESETRPDVTAEWVETEREQFRKRHDRWLQLNAIEEKLTPLARIIFQLKRNPPPEFVVMSRNMCPKERYTINILARYTDSKRAHVRAALHNIEAVVSDFKISQCKAAVGVQS